MAAPVLALAPDDTLATRIVVASGSTALRGRLRGVLGEARGAVVIGEVDTLSAAEGLARRLGADAVVVDQRVVGETAAAALASLAQTARVVVLAEAGAAADVGRYGAAGVESVLDRRRELEHVLPALGLRRDRPTRVNAWRAVAERLEGLVEHGGDLILALDEDSVIRFASAPAERMLGAAPSDLIGTDLFDLVHPEDARDLGAALAGVLGREHTARLELRLRRGAADWVWTEAVITNRLTDPRIQAVVVIARDVGDRKLKETLLAERAREQEALAELGSRALMEPDLPAFLADVARTVRHTLAVDAVDLWELAPDGATLRLVAAAGWPGGLTAAAPLAVTPDSQAHFTLVAGDVVVVADAPRERRFRPAPFVTTRGLRAGATVAVGSPPVGMLGAHTRTPRPFGPSDLAFLRAAASLVAAVIERRALERDLRASESRYRGLLEQASDAVLLVAADGRLLEANPAACELSGYARDALLALRFEEAFAPEERERVRARLAALRGRETTLFEGRLRRPDGTVVDVEASARALPDSGFLAGLRDVSERKRLEAQLHQAQRMEALGRLAGGVAHDFNNVLSVITGCAQLLRQDLAAGRPEPDDVDEIIAAANRAQALTRQLLAFSKRQMLDPEVLSLDAIVHGLRAVLGRLLREDVALELTLEAGDVAVRVDPGAIEQVLANLALNARDAMPGGGRFTVTTRAVRLARAEPAVQGTLAPGAYALLEVADSGVGMTADVLARAFEPFFTTKGPGAGTGLGLASVLGLVKQSGGELTIASAPGAGTAVRVYLPLAAHHAATAAAAPAVGGTETILLVEDDPAVRQTTRRLLERRGYRVLAADTPDAALNLVTGGAAAIDLLLSDVVMPDVNGPTLARLVRAVRPGLPVLFVSGYADPMTATAADEVAGAVFLPKPLDAADLAAKVRQALDAAR
jgi:PAS domain S-box-containing protein